MFRKKAQAAMEFLMTYGWAILVVLVAIGALAYFGVLDPAKFLPERCTGTPGLDCVDTALVEGNYTIFALKNNIGYTINITLGGGATTRGFGKAILTDSFATACGGTAGTLRVNNGSWHDEHSVLVKNNEQFLIKINCTADIPGPRVKGDIKFEYKNQETGLTHVASTSITAKNS